MIYVAVNGWGVNYNKKLFFSIRRRNKHKKQVVYCQLLHSKTAPKLNFQVDVADILDGSFQTNSLSLKKKGVICPEMKLRKVLLKL